MDAGQGTIQAFAFVATAFTQDDAEAQRRKVAAQLRPKVPKLAAFMDDAEPGVLTKVRDSKTPADLV